MRILSAVAGAAMLVASQNATAAAYTDYGAWQRAFFDLQATMPAGVQLGLVPINVSLIAITDGYGSFTDPNEKTLASIGYGLPPSEWVSRTYEVGGYFGTNVGSFSARFGCHSAFNPCLGAEVIEIAFSQAVFGLSGQLTYDTHMLGGDRPGYGEPIIPFEAAFDAATARTYDGFSV
ncbi:hypothetical protein [Elioraea rosea]|uniref:hypothetical protein n=1 Tax=Elioraea rosea TaxID=2492390 RepID=UPI001186C7AE|nr:hypothetical protein [Elioraea rosea]